MEDRTKTSGDEIEIDLPRVFGALAKKAWLIALVAVVCAVATFLGTLFFVTPTYQSAAMFYVNNSSFSLGEASLSISSADISASRGLVKSYIVILNTEESLEDVIDYAGVDRTYAELKQMISAAAVDSTEIFRVVVTSTDPVEAEKIADAIAYILPKRISSIIEGTSAKVVNSARLPVTPSSPSYTKNAMLGFAAGLLVTAVLVVLRELMDITIRKEEDIVQCCQHPILAAVPDMGGHTRGNHYGYESKKMHDVKAAQKNGKQPYVIGGDISFAATEAYKLLRTKLQFSFTDEGGCRVVGVSSALTNEGKSLTSVNLAYSLSQLGSRILLVDCDMRRPSLAEKLPVRTAPGLSDFLTGQGHGDSLIQLCGIKGEERAFHVISSGRIPPNPMELLSSVKMKKMVERLRESYDYIILDLPPVGEVSDALAVSRLTDGMLIVVRQNYCDRNVLNSAIRRFEFVDARILGVVFNATGEEQGSKYYRKYYKKYYQRNAKSGGADNDGLNRRTKKNQ